MVNAGGLLDTLAARITAMPGSSRVLIGIAGPPGAGKSTLAAALAARLAGGATALDSPVAHVPMDGFHLADAALDLLGLRDRKGAPETFDALGYAALLARIRAGEPVWAPAFERNLEQPIAGSIPVGAATRIVLSEGNYLLLPDRPWSSVRAQFSEVWYVTLDDEQRRDRLIRRHVEFGKSPAQARAWVAAVDDRNAALIEASASAADHVVDLTGTDLCTP
jgi:pantothenate kinase